MSVAVCDTPAGKYKYLGFVPVKLGPSGKMLALDLVFDNK